MSNNEVRVLCYICGRGVKYGEICYKCKAIRGAQPYTGGRLRSNTWNGYSLENFHSENEDRHLLGTEVNYDAYANYRL